MMMLLMPMLRQHHFHHPNNHLYHYHHSHCHYYHQYKQVHQYKKSTIQADGISGIIIPLYIYPTSFAWNLIANEKIVHPNVPIVTIINPNSGPGTYQDPNYVNGINKLRSAGVTVIGYVYTSYASRPITAVEQDVRVYKTFYPNINGIMFDEMNNVAGAGHESYYSTVSNYAKAFGLSFTVGNAGADVPSSFVGYVRYNPKLRTSRISKYSLFRWLAFTIQQIPLGHDFLWRPVSFRCVCILCKTIFWIHIYHR